MGGNIETAIMNGNTRSLLLKPTQILLYPVLFRRNLYGLLRDVARAKEALIERLDEILTSTVFRKLPIVLTVNTLIIDSKYLLFFSQKDALISCAALPHVHKLATG